MARCFHLRQEQLLPRPRDEVFGLFADVSNLERITPEFLRFQVTSPLPVAMRSGALIEYRLRLFGVPFNWQTRIESWDPPVRFTDTQLKGPYQYWHHTHEFVEVPEGTLCVDTVDYELPLGLLGRLAHLLFVRGSLDKILRIGGNRSTRCWRVAHGWTSDNHPRFIRLSLPNLSAPREIS